MEMDGKGATGGGMNKFDELKKCFDESVAGIRVVDCEPFKAPVRDQADLLIANADTENAWVSIGIPDEDGFSEVVALAHPANARFIAASYNFMEFVIKMQDFLDAAALGNTDADDLQRMAQELMAEINCYSKHQKMR